MRRLPLILIGLMIALTACDSASRRGEAAGHDFMAAWGDTAAMRQSVERFNTLRGDSLRWPWETKAANRAFASVLLSDGRDSLTQAAHIIVLSPRELAQLKAPPMVDLLMKRQFDTDSASDYLALIHYLCNTFGYQRHAEVFDSTLQAIVDGFSMREQMNVYVQSSRPAALGAALADDANQPDADTNDINARIKMLQGMYTPADFKTFEDAYNARLKKKDKTVN